MSTVDTTDDAPAGSTRLDSGLSSATITADPPDITASRSTTEEK